METQQEDGYWLSAAAARLRLRVELEQSRPSNSAGIGEQLRYRLASLPADAPVATAGRCGSGTPELTAAIERLRRWAA